MRVAVHLLKDFASRALEAAGACPSDAQKKAELLVWCDQIGRDTQGVWRLPMICQRLQHHLHQSPAHYKLDQVSTSQMRMDGDAGLGYLVAMRAMEEAVGLAASCGTGVVAVRNASHLGAAAIYVNHAAEHNMIGLCFSNSVPKVAPTPSAKKIWGTNPLAIGIPRANGQALLIDMATASSAGSTLKKAEQLGLPVQDGVLVDSQGGGTSDPTVLHREGAVLPMAGFKGFSLGLVVEVFSAILTEAAMTEELRSMHEDFDGPAGNGHLMLAMNIANFLPLEQFYSRLEQLVAQIYSAGEPGIRLPGELRWESFEQSLADGITMDSQLFESLQRLAEQLNITLFPLLD